MANSLEYHIDQISYEMMVAHLVDNFARYSIVYSENGAKAVIGNFYLEKQSVPLESKFYRVVFDRGYAQGFNAYHIGHGETEPGEVVTYDNNPLLFYVLDGLDANCYKLYIRRQKRAQRVAAVKSLPSRIAKTLGLSKVR